MKSRTIGSATGASNVTGAAANDLNAAAWEAQIDDSDSETGSCIYIAAAIDTSTVTLNATLTSGRTALLTAHADAAFNAPTYAAATTRARINVSSGYAVEITGAGFTFEKHAVSTSTGSNIALRITTSSTIYVRRCSVSGSNYFSIFDDNRTGVISNSVMCGYTHWGAYNSTLYHCSASSIAADGGCYYQCVCYACVAQDVPSGPQAYDSCGGEDCVAPVGLSAPNVNARSVNGVFKDTGSTTWDLNLRGLNGGLLQGVADYSGTVADVTTDLNGNARPAAAGFPIDPGCAQIASGPSVLAYASSGAVSSSTSTTETVSINVPAGAKTLVVCASGNDAISSADWNGTAMTAAAGDQNAGGVRTKVFTLESPATGTHNITVTYTSCNRRWIAAFAIAIAGDTNAPTLDVGDGTTGSSVTSLSKSTTTAVANEGAFDILASGQSGANPVANSPQVLREKCSSPSFFEASVSCRLAVSVASTSDGWTFDSSTNVALSVVYMKPGGGGGGGSSGTITSMLSLMGVG